MSFSADLDKFIKKTNQKADKVYRAIGLQMFGQIMERTPVGNPDLWKTTAPPAGYVGGRLRANWQTTLSSPANGELDVTSEHIAQAQLTATVNGVTIRDTIFFTNNLPYAASIEHGHSLTQAPQGMVKITLTEFEQALGKLAQGV